MTGNTKLRQPICPRCRYDQSGDVVRWTEQCPLAGLCPECGLRFEWREVFHGAWEPEWWVERRESSLRFRALRTLLHALWPITFWKRIRLEFDGHLWRSLRILLIVLAFFYLSEVLAAAAVLFDISVSAAVYSPALKLSWIRTLWPFHTWNRPNTLWLLAYAACFPLGALLLPQTRRRAKVALVHLVRVFIYATSAGLVALIATTVPASLLLFAENLFFSNRLQAATTIWLFDMLFLMPTLLCLAVTALSWWSACRRYLRLDHPSAVAIALITIASLVPFTLAVCIDTISRFGFYQTFFG